MGLFHRKKSIADSGLLKGATDSHCHILYGVDDGVKTLEESLSILSWLEGEQGLTEVWFTPHIMEDVPNTTEGLQRRYEEFRSAYKGGLKLHLSAEYMLDNLFEARLRERDLLTHGGNRVLVETSALTPPYNFWDTIQAILAAGYRPLIAHPERYRYMQPADYKRLHELGCLLQLNLPSVAGYYGESAQKRALDLLEKGWYCMAGSDCHRFKVLQHQYAAKELKDSTIQELRPLMAGLPEEE